MSLRDTVQIAVRGLSANKLRAFLTLLGVLIGVASVIILVAVGTGSSRAVQKRIESLGTNTILVLNRGRFGRGPARTGTQATRVDLTRADVDALGHRTDAPDVLTASPVTNSNTTATFQGATYAFEVTGTTPSYLSATNYSVAQGRPFTDQDVVGHRRVILIGQTVVQNLFGAGQDPVGASIKLSSGTWQVIGVLAPKGSNGVQDQDAIGLAPYSSVQDTLAGSTTFSQITVQATSSKTLDAAQAEVTNILDSRKKVTAANTPFTVLNQGALLATSQSTTSTFTILLGAVAAISLLVGGIGVMNIMLVTVTERTREIGIRKAVGAPKSAILTQFLVEAVLLSVIGGTIGVVVGLVGSEFRIVGVQPVVAPYSVFLAFAVALAVGLFFGLYPANRAASMRPIDALRYE